MRDFSSIFTILPNGDNADEVVLKESQNNFDRPIENGSSKSSSFKSEGDNLRISQIQMSLVMFDYKILQMFFMVHTQ